MESLPFFVGFKAPQLVAMLFAFLLFLIPDLGVRAMNAIKVYLGWEGRKAHFLILGMITAISLGFMAVTGVFYEIVWNLGTILAQITAALIPAKLAYKELKIKEPWASHGGAGKTTVVGLVLLLFLFTGCGALRNEVNANYGKYIEKATEIAENPVKTFKITCPDTGCNFKSLSYLDPRDRVVLQQIKDNPWVRVVGKVAMTGLGVYGAVEVVKSVADAAGNTYSNSFNDIGGDHVQTQIGAERGVIGNTFIGDDRSSIVRDSHNPITENPVSEVPEVGAEIH